MISLAYCEDNPIQRGIILEYLKDYSNSKHMLKVNAYEDASKLLDAVSGGQRYQIYLLDIVMSGINGMEMAATLRQLGDGGIIIFLTASTEYAAASYDVHAFYYLMKPVMPEKLNKVLDMAVESIRKDQEQKITIKTAGGEVLLSTGNIMYVEVKDRALCYHMSDGRMLRSQKLRGSFREAAAPLLKDRSFAMCGVSMLINLHCIEAVDSEGVMLRDGTVLVQSRSGCSELKKAWKDRLS